MAAFKDGWFAKLMTGVSSFLSAIPNYLGRHRAALFLRRPARLVPLATRAYGVGLTEGFNWPFISSDLDHAILPIATYVIVSWGGWALVMKRERHDHAGCRLCPGGRILGPVQQTGHSVVHRAQFDAAHGDKPGAVFGSSWRGRIHRDFLHLPRDRLLTLINAVNSRDDSLMMGCFILITVAVVFANLLVDLTYPLVDPRIVSPVQSKTKSVRDERRARGAPGPVGSSLAEQTMVGAAAGAALDAPVTDVS